MAGVLLQKNTKVGVRSDMTLDIARAYNPNKANENMGVRIGFAESDRVFCTQLDSAPRR